MDALPLLNPPQYFGIVESKVYRSNKFTSSAFPFIQNLDLKTIVHLTPDEFNTGQLLFMEQNDITLIHLGSKNWLSSHWKPISEDMVKEAIECILDVSKHPIMVMCSTGVHVTGTVIGCLRRLQNWSLTSIIDKYRNQASLTSTRFENEQFIELFDVDLVHLPSKVPEWFIDEKFKVGEDPNHYSHYYYATMGPLTTPNVKYSVKESIVGDDED